MKSLHKTFLATSHGFCTAAINKPYRDTWNVTINRIIACNQHLLLSASSIFPVDVSRFFPASLLAGIWATNNSYICSSRTKFANAAASFPLITYRYHSANSEAEEWEHRSLLEGMNVQELIVRVAFLWGSAMSTYRRRPEGEYCTNFWLNGFNGGFGKVTVKNIYDKKLSDLHLNSIILPSRQIPRTK